MSSPSWKAAEARRQAARITAGLCIKCGKEPNMPGCKVGQICNDKHKERRRKHREQAAANGVCRACSNKVPNKQRAYCDPCKEKAKTVYRRRIANGLCMYCDNPPVPGQKRCEYHREKTNKAVRGVVRNLRKQILAAYGGACKCCGETIPEFLQVDHINGGGCAHRRELAKAKTTFYQWLRANNFPQEGFQILCANCNRAKGQYGTCPHQRTRMECVRPNPS